MKDYIICTDSACDLPPALLAEWGVPYCTLTFKFDGDDTIYSNGDMDVKTFYRKMREGGVAKTSAINTETFAKLFEQYLQEGKDVIYIGFSSGLSATYNAGRVAALNLRESYPDCKVLAVDSLSGSVGQGLLIYLALQKKKEGATIDETVAYLKEIRTKICHWVTVEDLVYLKRGGRISPTVAFVGNALGLKPTLCINNEGKLLSHSKARGRKRAIAALVEKYGEYARNPANGMVFISHADCLEDAQEVAAQLLSRYNTATKVMADIGPVIGAHAGPGTIALCFVGKER